MAAPSKCVRIAKAVSVHMDATKCNDDNTMQEDAIEAIDAQGRYDPCAKTRAGPHIS